MIIGRIVIWHPAEGAPVIMQYTDINLYRLHLDQVHRSDGWLLIRGGVNSSHQFDEYIKCESITKYRSELFV